ncbi:phage tail assembly protein [Marinobacterium stanieri]|uniref:Phage tail assembly chaperone protein, E, or 41 or 14 n=1 Tax=Marinobacterium stanieri TaxID=49186 RepID=A0A1N6Q3J7_9GAMM|nr:phage tail assembly protein [Marinobacterium stanieri]SIQ11039.1 Phage tail assembly chaperone protein, E, or 41 or 14 [Marinobacterium stanieri]
MKAKTDDKPQNEVTIVEPEKLPPHSVRLDEPLKRGNQVIDVITLRKPKSGELRGLSLQEVLSLDVNSLQTLLPRISSPTLTKQDVADMDPADLTQLGVQISVFFVQKQRKEEAFLTA